MLVAGLLISRSSECVLKADKQGRTCLHFASAYGHRDMVGMLLGQSALVNATDKKLWTPLHCESFQFSLPLSACYEHSPTFYSSFFSFQTPVDTVTEHALNCLCRELTQQQTNVSF